MKNFFRSISFLFTLTLFLFSCEDDSKPPPPPPGPPIVTATSTPTIQGQVKSMTTKQPLGGVMVQGSIGPSFITNSDGTFSIPISGVSATTQYTKPGYDTLRQEYSDVTYVDSIIVYLEDSSTLAVKTKKLSGVTKRKLLKGGGVAPIDSIKVLDIQAQDSVFTTGGGIYLLNFLEEKPNFQYQFKKLNIINIQLMNVKNLTDIKDSIKLDIVFTGSITGIDIDTTMMPPR